MSGVPALGDETDRIKTHHNTAVIFPDNMLRALCAPETFFPSSIGKNIYHAVISLADGLLES